MSVLTIASNASKWKGYEYYEDKKVISWEQIDENQYSGLVSGSGDKKYKVIINLKKAKKSICDCPHAEGTRRSCKHKVALFFTIFLEEAKSYYNKILEYERMREEYEDQRHDEIIEYVNSLSLEDLRTELIYALLKAENNRDYW